MPKRLSSFFVSKGIASAALIFSIFSSPISAGTSRTSSAEENENDFYISAAGGATLLGTAGRLGIGYDFGDIRTEIGYTKSGGDVYGQIPINIETESTIGTLFWDIPLGHSTYPSLGIGLGSTNVSINGSKKVFGKNFKSDSSWTRTYKFSLGWTWLVTETTDIFIQGDVDLFDKFSIAGQSIKSGNHPNLNALLGLRFRF